MKKLYSLFLLSFFSLVAHSQPYGNEWIKFSIVSSVSKQPYLKVQVWQEGIHRLTFSDINQFITTSNTYNPKQFQIFHKGIEQFINVFGESDNVFDSTDYIEF